MEKIRKVIFIQPHPIHWFSPQFEFISKNATFDFEVFYCTQHGLNNEIDSGFGKKIDFNVALLKGHKYRFLKNFSFITKHTDRLLSSVNLEIFYHLWKAPKQTLFVCHGWSRFTYLFVLLFGNLFGKRVGLRAEAPIIHERKYSKLKLFLRKIFFKKILFPRINYFLYIGTHNKYFYKFYGVKESRLHFSPYCVNNSFFKKKYQENLHSGYSRRNNSVFKILFVGKLINKKNPEFLIKAILKQKNKNIKCIIIGDGKLKNPLENKFKNAINEGLVEFKGFQDQQELSMYYTTSNLFVLPSGFGETWGLVVNEACNFELPLLVSNRVGSAIDLVNKNGFIFTYENSEDFSIKLNTMINNDYLEDMGKQSAINVKNHTYSTILRTLETLVLD